MNQNYADYKTHLPPASLYSYTLGQMYVQAYMKLKKCVNTTIYGLTRHLNFMTNLLRPHFIV